MIPKDPMILFSFINTRLRDSQLSLEELCSELDIDRVDLEEKLRAVGFEYDAALNRFC